MTSWRNLTTVPDLRLPIAWNPEHAEQLDELDRVHRRPCSNEVSALKAIAGLRATRRPRSLRSTRFDSVDLNEPVAHTNDAHVCRAV
jgi:hypothetical protein